MTVHTIDTGTFKLDGGAMFGVVPKSLWNRLNPADDNNLCTWAMRCLLVQSGGLKILIDTGIGTKQDERFRSHFEPKNQENLELSLNKLDLSKDDITDVFLTHLHFDHVGGAVAETKTGLVPAFPNAQYWTSQTHYDWAMNPNPREKASFLKENIYPLVTHDVLRYIKDISGTEFIPGVTYHFVDGHTRAMTYLKIAIGMQTLIYCADLIPSSYHIGLPYVMSYDVNPLTTLKEKEVLLEEAVEGNYILIFEHDPIIEAATLKRDDRGRIVADQLGKLSELI